MGTKNSSQNFASEQTAGFLGLWMKLIHAALIFFQGAWRHSNKDAARGRIGQRLERIDHSPKQIPVISTFHTKES